MWISKHWNKIYQNQYAFPDINGVNQWLGRRYLAGGLSLIYAWSIVDTWPLRG